MVTTTASASHLAPRYVSALSVGVTIDKAREIASQTPAFIPCPHVRLTLRSAAKLHSGPCFVRCISYVRRRSSARSLEDLPGPRQTLSDGHGLRNAIAHTVRQLSSDEECQLRGRDAPGPTLGHRSPPLNRQRYAPAWTEEHLKDTRYATPRTRQPSP